MAGEWWGEGGTGPAPWSCQAERLRWAHTAQKPPREHAPSVSTTGEVHASSRKHGKEISKGINMHPLSVENMI